MDNIEISLKNAGNYDKISLNFLKLANGVKNTDPAKYREYYQKYLDFVKKASDERNKVYK